MPDDRFDRLHEGVPSWLVRPCIAWVRSFIVSYGPYGSGAYYDSRVMDEMEMAIRFDPPLPRRHPSDTLRGIVARFEDNDPQAIDVLDFLLGRLPGRYAWQEWSDTAIELRTMLDSGGSVWDVTSSDDRESAAGYQLTRRVAGPAEEVIAEVGSVSERAGQHLNEAWTQLLGRDPDPSAAYQAAVSAVEVAARPVISPNNTTATLGTMRGQLRADVRDQPGMWTFALGDAQVVVDMISALWETQLRHGDEAAPYSETQEEADAAVALALTLVRWFTIGAIRRT
ncbi:MAG TPA: hypothetical protein VNS09_07335 [Solirubrobacter sp.]|nr:hypothetical protein [Solirubrobacter sp.]